MTADEQFWWNWWVQFGTAVATFLAVVAALFGNGLRAWLAPPVLRISLKDPRGNKTDATLQYPDKATAEVTQARWYHVRVENERRWAPATQVQVFLLRIEQPNAMGQSVAVWTGEIPMKWRHMTMNPNATRTVGNSVDSDLVCVFKPGMLQLQPLATPSPLDRFVQHTDGCKMTLVLQARGLEAHSNVLTVQIGWDGTWHDEADEMVRRMSLKAS